MTTPTITVKQLVDKTIEIAGRDPSKTYGDGEGTCYYVDGKFDPDGDVDEQDELRPGCIYGHALHELGIPLHELAQPRLNGSEISNVAAAYVDGWADASRTVRTAITDVQNSQDNGNTWGSAVSGLHSLL